MPRAALQPGWVPRDPPPRLARTPEVHGCRGLWGGTFPCLHPQTQFCLWKRFPSHSPFQLRLGAAQTDQLPGIPSGLQRQRIPGEPPPAPRFLRSLLPLPGRFCCRPRLVPAPVPQAVAPVAGDQEGRGTQHQAAPTTRAAPCPCSRRCLRTLAAGLAIPAPCPQLAEGSPAPDGMFARTVFPGCPTPGDARGDAWAVLGIQHHSHISWERSDGAAGFTSSPVPP